MKNYYLAIDIGASSGRHILACTENRKLTLSEIYRFENGFREQDGSLIWDIAHLESEVKNGLKVCADMGITPKSVSIDTWGVDYVLLDDNKTVLSPVYCYRDARTAEAVKEVESIIPFETLYAKTGIQKQSFNTVYQLYCDKKSGKLNKAKDFMMMPDYLAYTLTGVIKNEYTNATTTGMVNAETKQWDEDLIETLGYPKELFLPLSEPKTQVGCFTEETAKEVGFMSKVVLCPTHDTASAVAGCPMKENSLYISSGTWSLIGTEIINPVLNTESMNANFTNEGGIDYHFRYLKNYMGMWLFQNIRKDLNKKYTYDEMMHMAQESTYVDYFDVNDESIVAPDNMTKAINALLGKALPLGDMLSCVYHSLARSYKTAVEEIERLTGKTIDSIFIVGGGSKDAYLNGLTANYTGKKVFIGLSEATATGNLITQIMAEENLTLAEARQLVFSSFKITEVLP